MPLFRTLTLKILTTLLMTLAFNKNCAPLCLKPEELQALSEAI